MLELSPYTLKSTITPSFPFNYSTRRLKWICCVLQLSNGDQRRRRVQSCAKSSTKIVIFICTKVINATKRADMCIVYCAVLHMVRIMHFIPPLYVPINFKLSLSFAFQFCHCSLFEVWTHSGKKYSYHVTMMPFTHKLHITYYLHNIMKFLFYCRNKITFE